MKKRIRWSAKLAYVVGLIASDGCLSKDGRHIDFTSKDFELVQTFSRLLKLKNKIGTKGRSKTDNRLYYRVEFGNVSLYRFLLKIGITSKKSKTIGALLIPDKYFIDFLRGSFDGDGHYYSYWDPRWRSSFQLYTGFSSASLKHIGWLQCKIESFYNLKGIIKKGSRAFQLEFAKYSSILLLEKIYYKKGIPFLTRKYSKIQAALSIIAEQ